MNKQQRLQNNLQGRTMTRGEESKSDLASLIELGRKAQPRNFRPTPDGERYQQIPGFSHDAAVNGALSLGTEIDPVVIEQSTASLPLVDRPAGETLKIESVAAQNSRCVQAGAHLIILTADDQLAVSEPGLVAFRETIGELLSVDPADFTTIAELSEVTAGALPVKRATVNREGLNSKAVSFNISRSEAKKLSNEALAQQIMVSVAAGISQAADSEILSAIDATTPAAFSLSSAAASGARFEQLRGLVGTAGTGATVDQGILYANDVSAEFTSATANTIIGDFSKAAVVITDDIQLLVNRTSTSGEITVTAWVEMIGLVSDSEKFWAGA